MRTFVSLLLCACVGCSQPAASVSTSAAKSQTVAVVDAAKIHADYSANQIKADEDYLKKLVRVTGEVKTVEKDTDGRYFVGLSVFFPVPVLTADQVAQLSTREKKLYNDPSPMAVKCFVAPGKEAVFAQIKRGQKASVTGTCTGVIKNPADQPPALLVVLENCTTD